MDQTSKQYALTRGLRIRKGKTKDQIVLAFTVNGRECRERFDGPVTPENLVRAGRVLALINEEIKLGKFDYKRHFPKSKRAGVIGITEADPRITDLLNEWLNRSDKLLAPSTVLAYRKIVEGYIRPKFGAKRVKSLAAKEIRAWIENELRGCKNKTIRNITSAFRTVLERAVNDDLIEANPFDRIRLRELLPKHQPRSKDVIDPFSDSEKRDIVAAATDTTVKNLIIFLLGSGVRLSEAFGLKTNDIDLVQGIVKIKRAVVVGKEKTTKTEKGMRELPLFPAARLAIENQLTLGESSDGYVFWRPDTKTGWKNDGEFRKSFWKKTLERAGVRYRYPYQCRHTFATSLLNDGTPIAYVSECLGHTTIEMTMRHYIRSKSITGLPANKITDWLHGQDQE